MDAHRCWAGIRKGASSGALCILCDVESNDDAIWMVLNRGGMAADKVPSVFGALCLE